MRIATRVWQPPKEEEGESVRKEEEEGPMLFSYLKGVFNFWLNVDYIIILKSEINNIVI